MLSGYFISATVALLWLRIDGCSLFLAYVWFLGLAMYLGQSRRSPFAWLIFTGGAVVIYCAAYLMVPPQNVPAYIWPLAGMACVLMAVAYTCAVIDCRGKERDRDEAPFPPGADTLRLWQEKRRPADTGIQAERSATTTIKPLG